MLEVTAGQKRCMVGSLDSWKVLGSLLFSFTILLQFLLVGFSVNCFVTIIMSCFYNSYRILNSLSKNCFAHVFNQGLVWRWSSCFSRWKRWPYALCMGQWTLKFSSGNDCFIVSSWRYMFYYFFMVFVFVVIILLVMLCYSLSWTLFCSWSRKQ